MALVAAEENQWIAHTRIGRALLPFSTPVGRITTAAAATTIERCSLDFISPARIHGRLQLFRDDTHADAIQTVFICVHPTRQHYSNSQPPSPTPSHRTQPAKESEATTHLQPHGLLRQPSLAIRVIGIVAYIRRRIDKRRTMKAGNATIRGVIIRTIVRIYFRFFLSSHK